MRMTGHQADALAAYLVTLRPDWTKRYVLAALRDAQSISSDVERLTRVSVRAALTPTIIKPDVIAMTGAHWKAQLDTEPDRPAGVAERCRDCHGFHSDASPCDVQQSAHWRERIAELRSNHADARRRVCSHGIRREQCSRHDNERETP